MRISLINDIVPKAAIVFMSCPIPTLWYLIICSKHVLMHVCTSAYYYSHWAHHKYIVTLRYNQIP